MKSLNLIKNCLEERDVLSGAGTSVRACSAYIYIKDEQKVGPEAMQHAKGIRCE